MYLGSKKLMVFVSVFVFIALATTTLVAQSDGPKVIKRDSTAYGRTYSEWSAAWEQWATSIPFSNHPLFDKGACSVGQSGPVWFLGGKYCANGDTTCGYTNVVRSCTIPSDKALYIAVTNSEDSMLEDPGRTTINELRAFTAEQIDPADVSITVDGAAIPDVKNRFRVQSPAFSFTLPNDNMYTALYGTTFNPGTYFPGVDDGVYVMLSPLPAGYHVIQLKGYFPQWDFGFDVTYSVIVQ